MALPNIMRRLFRNDGYGPLLKPEIIPFTSDLASNVSNVAASTEWVKSVSDTPIYVDAANGSDSNSGLTQDSPLQTITAALALPKIVSSGNRFIYVAPGTYDEAVSVDREIVTIRLQGNVTLTDRLSVFNGGFLRIDEPEGVPCTLTVNYGTLGSSMLATSCSGIRCSVSTTVLKNCLTCNNGSCIVFNDSVQFNVSNIPTGSSSAVMPVTRNSSIIFYGQVTVSGTSSVYSISVTYGSSVHALSGFDDTNYSDGYGINVSEGSVLSIANGTIYIHSDTTNLALRVDNGSFAVILHNGTSATIANKSTGSVVTAYNGSNILLFCNPGKTFKLVSSNGSSTYCLSSRYGSSIYLFGSGTFNITGTYSVVAQTMVDSLVYIDDAPALTGSPTGQRYSVGRTSSIVVNGQGANRIPGSTAGGVTGLVTVKDTGGTNRSVSTANAYYG